MSKLKSMLAMAMVSAMAAQSEFSEYGGQLAKPKVIEPDFKRKKCKSCSQINSCHGVYKYHNKQACEYYSKRKK